jgi:hypothetical protein
MGDSIPHGGKTAVDLAEGQRAMGIDWMAWDELKESDAAGLHRAHRPCAHRGAGTEAA